MANADVEVKFGADVSALQNSLAAVKGALDGLNTGLAGLKASFGALSASIAQQAAAMSQLSAAMQASAADAKGAEDGSNGFSKALTGLLGAVDEVNSLGKFGEVVGELQEKLAEAAGKLLVFTASLLGVDVAPAAPELGAWALGLAALSAAVVAATLALQHLYETNATVRVAFDAVGAAAEAVWDVIVLLAEVVGHLVEGFDALIGLALKPYVDQLRESWDFWTAAIERLWAGLTTVLEVIDEFIARHFAIEISAIAAAWNGVRAAIAATVSVIAGALKVALDWLFEKLSELIGLAGRFIGLKFPDIAGQWSKTLNDMAAAFRDAASAAGQLWAALTGHAPPARGLSAGQHPGPAPGPRFSKSRDEPADSTSDQKCAGAATSIKTCGQQTEACEAERLQARVAGNERERAADLASQTEMMDAFKAAEQEKTKAVEQGGKDRVQAEAQAENAMADHANEAAANFKRAWDATIDPMVSKFTSGMLAMAQGTKSFVQVVRELGQQMLEDMLKTIDQMVERWLWKEAGQTLATRLGVAQRTAAEQAGSAKSLAVSGVTAMKQVTNSAVKAAGEAYSALAGIPIVGPALGAAAAGVAFAAVEAFGGLVASAAGGYDIPSGVNPMTQLHQNEMVLPASLANPMRAMLSDYRRSDSGAPSPTNDGGGDTHLHLHVQAMDAQSFKGFLRSNSDHLATVLQEMARRGMRTA